MSSDFMLLRDKENYAVLVRLLDFFLKLLSQIFLQVCTSRYWFNYRHFANTLSVYILIKKLGIPDRNIILMNANDALSDPRNPLVGRIYNIPDNLESNIIDDRFEVDYRGDEVNPDSFSRVLTGHHYHTTSPSKRLDLNNNSNILIYITGHGGNEFMKFHDYEEFSAQDFSYIIHEMHIKKRFNEILIISDTCQAETLTSLIKTPNIISISSAKEIDLLRCYTFGCLRSGMFSNCKSICTHLTCSSPRCLSSSRFVHFTIFDYNSDHNPGRFYQDETTSSIQQNSLDLLPCSPTNDQLSLKGRQFRPSNRLRAIYLSQLLTSTKHIAYGRRTEFRLLINQLNTDHYQLSQKAFNTINLTRTYYENYEDLNGDDKTTITSNSNPANPAAAQPHLTAAPSPKPENLATQIKRQSLSTISSSTTTRVTATSTKSRYRNDEVPLKRNNNTFPLTTQQLTLQPVHKRNILI
eukprot:gene7227-14741_t